MFTDQDYQEYQLMDGTIIGGCNALELVEAMAEKKFITPRSRLSYRRSSAKRAKSMYGADINPDTDETYIDSLVRHQLLQRLI